MNTEAPVPEPSYEPHWRFVKFFICVPWPIAMPAGYFQVADRKCEVGCGQLSPEWLHDFMRPEIAQQIASDPQRSFVVLRFHRQPLALPSAVEHFQEVHRMAESWATFYRVSGLIPGVSVAARGVDPVEPVATYGTIIEATTCLMDAAQGKAWALEDAFDRCLRECAILIDSYAQTSGDLRMGFITRSTVLPMVPAVLIDPENRRAEASGLADVNAGYAFPAPPPADLSTEQADEIGLRSLLTVEGEPYVTVRHWQRLAHRAFRVDGDFAAAVIFCHTAGEVFFDALLLRLAWEEITFFRGSCLTQEEVASWFSARSSLSTRLRSRYHHRLFGGWHDDRPGNPIYEWERKVARLRNRIVHAGHRPPEQEAQGALEVLNSVESHALDVIVRDRNRTRYPLTVFMMLGKLGGVTPVWWTGS